jgi:hypothetical protein
VVVSVHLQGSFPSISLNKLKTTPFASSNLDWLILMLASASRTSTSSGAIVNARVMRASQLASAVSSMLQRVSCIQNSLTGGNGRGVCQSRERD